MGETETCVNIDNLLHANSASNIFNNATNYLLLKVTIASCDQPLMIVYLE